MRVLGTEGATVPFFSPDGEWIGYFADGRLQKVSVTTGASVTITDVAEVPAGADWSEDDTVIFGTLSSGLWRVSSEGGTPVALTNPDAARGGGTHGWPQILSDGTKVLFAVATDAGPRLALLHLDTGKWSMLESFGLVDGGQHLPGGFLLYSQLGRLLVAPVNSETLERSGPPASVSDTMEVHVGASHALRKAWVVVSPAGHMAFVSATATGGVDQLVWVGRDGSAQPITNDVGFFSQPRFSPDGQRLAVVRTPDLWVYGVERPTRARLTGGSASEPVWSWDSRRIIFASNRAGPVSLYWVPADGSADAELLRSGDYALFPHSISRDGKTLAFYELNPSSFRDIWMLPLGGNAEPDSFVVTSFNERSPVFSPDGNSVAYVSDQAGRDEIYVASFPGPGGRVPVSTDGGTEPVWSRDGRELFYRNGDQLLVVQALEDGSFGTPLVLFTGQYKRGWPLSGVREYDISADGQRFVMVRANPDAGTLTRVHVVLNWLVEIPDLLGRVN